MSLRICQALASGRLSASSSRSAKSLAALAILLLALALLNGSPARAQASPTAPEAHWLTLAEEGASMARSHWWDERLGFYERTLNDHQRYPLATIWDAAPLFETLVAIERAAPSPSHLRRLRAFAAKAETYLDRGLRPLPGYAPYPGDRSSQSETWFDDDAWWGIAFDDAYQVTHQRTYLSDAERAMRYAQAAGWDRQGGGMWWNTTHPYKSGPALASNALLAALIARQTGSASALEWTGRYLSWGDQHLADSDGMWENNPDDSAPSDYIESPMIYARELLCQIGQSSWCAGISTLAQTALQRFGLDAPQYDAIYAHWMLALAAVTGHPGWGADAVHDAQLAEANASNSEGLWLDAWNGGSLGSRVSEPGMLQTQSATSELYAWLAVYGASVS